jgi:hypothetical protein
MASTRSADYAAIGNGDGDYGNVDNNNYDNDDGDNDGNGVGEGMKRKCGTNNEEGEEVEAGDERMRRSGRKGSVGALPQGYLHKIPLPRVPIRQSPMSQVHTIPDYYELPYVAPTYTTPRSIVESAAYAFSPAWHAIAINSWNNLLSNLNGNITASLALNSSKYSD